MVAWRGDRPELNGMMEYWSEADNPVCFWKWQAGLSASLRYSLTPLNGGRGKDAGRPAPPAQIPACGFSAPGSSPPLTHARPPTPTCWLWPAGRLISFDEPQVDN